MKTSWSWAMFLHLSLSSVDCACNSACDIQLKNKVPGMKKNVYMAYRKPWTNRTNHNMIQGISCAIMCTDLLLNITIIILKFLNSRGKVNPNLLPLPFSLTLTTKKIPYSFWLNLLPIRMDPPNIRTDE